MNTFCLVAVLALAVANVGVLASVAPAFLTNSLVTPLAAVVHAGHGLEGQYVHDNTEQLYDDGSYRPEIRAVPLAASPYGLVPAGSGLEGQYVPDLTEKFSDDGSYKPQLKGVSLSPSPYGLVPSGSGLEGHYVPQLQAVKLAASPYGLTPAGSGLEGQYVHDITEKLYDDGSYKPGFYGAPAKVLALGVKTW